MSIDKMIDDWFGIFMNDKVVIPQRRGFPKEDTACLNSLKELIRNAITAISEESYEAGRTSILTELAHDQQKLLDGFAHPKECGECKKN